MQESNDSSAVSWAKIEPMYPIVHVVKGDYGGLCIGSAGLCCKKKNRHAPKMNILK